MFTKTKPVLLIFLYNYIFVLCCLVYCSTFLLQVSVIQQPVDKRVVTKLYELVNEGFCNLREIKRALHLFVKMELFQHQPLPDSSNRRFFPTKRDIRNHFNLAFAKRKLAEIDQENLFCLIEEWKKSGDEKDLFFFLFLHWWF